MRNVRAVVCLLLLAAVSLWAQEVPNIIKFSGTTTESFRNDSFGATFAIYKDSQGGAPIWQETQSIHADAQGHYTVLLGATSPSGIPADLFSNGEARWLGISYDGHSEQARTLLVSVPYAMKAGDASTLGGRSAKDFVTTDMLRTAVREEASLPKASTSISNTSTMYVAGATAPNNTSIISAAATAETATNFTDTTADQVVNITQNGTGAGLRATTASTTSNAIYGISTATTGTIRSVYGETNSTTNSTAGVYGIAKAATGVTYGVLGLTNSSTGTALNGTATSTTGNTIGLRGQVNSPTGIALEGAASATTAGASIGVYGFNLSATGVAGAFDNRAGGKILSLRNNSIEKLSVDGSGNVKFAGIITGNGSGLTNLPATTISHSVAAGAYMTGGSFNGSAAATFAVDATESATPSKVVVRDVGANIYANLFYGAGANFTGPNDGIYAEDTIADTTNRISIEGVSNSAPGAGVFGWSKSTTGSTYGVSGRSDADTGSGVYGRAYHASGVSFGVQGVVNSPNGVGVRGDMMATTANASVAGGTGVVGAYGLNLDLSTNSAATNGIGVNALNYANGGTPFALKAYASGATAATTGAEVRVDSASGTALRAINNGAGKIISGVGASSVEKFSVDGFGNVTIAGNLNVTGAIAKGSGTFKIDHPLDPENKFLSHSFVESPDMKNIYDGVVVLDSNGSATIELPEWFCALNKDYRYQLTAIGRPAPGLYVATEIENNRFTVSGGAAGQKISWQVTGNRQDPYAIAHPVIVEEDKPASMKGTYLHPDAYQK